MNADDQQTPKTDEKIYMASQWRLMWLKFKDHKLAVVSMYVVIVFYFVAVFCEFLSPNDPGRRNIKQKFSPPRRVHVFHDGGLRRPFVYAQIRNKHPETLRLTYAEDKARILPVRLFVKGDAYKLWELIPMSRHLLGLGDVVEVDPPADFVPPDLAPPDPNDPLAKLGDPNRLVLMGADRLGRDVFSRILYGSRISLSIGLIGVTISLVLGIVIGGISGYYGGWLDNLIQRGIEVLRSFPTIPLWLALSAAMPADWSQLRVYFCMTVILALIGWTGIARVVRGKILALREEDYAMAAKVAGVKEFSIIMRHLIPGFLSHLIVTVTIAIPGMILAETSLSFLRLGLRPPTISWGVLLQDSQNITTIALYPWLMYPAAFVVVAVLMFNFLGDGLRDAADPYKH